MIRIEDEMTPRGDEGAEESESENEGEAVPMAPEEGAETPAEGGDDAGM